MQWELIQARAYFLEVGIWPQGLYSKRIAQFLIPQSPQLSSSSNRCVIPGSMFCGVTYNKRICNPLQLQCRHTDAFILVFCKVMQFFRMQMKNNSQM